MSLDVSLFLTGAKRKQGSGVWVLDCGETRQITREEWYERFPYCEPVAFKEPEDVVMDDEVYWRNITHNLNKMAGAAGIYEACWRPEGIGVTHAKQLIPLLKAGLERLLADPEKFKAFNPKNGWGDYEGLVNFVRDYLARCEQYPEATVSVSR